MDGFSRVRTARRVFKCRGSHPRNLDAKHPVGLTSLRPVVLQRGENRMPSSHPAPGAEVSSGISQGTWPPRPQVTMHNIAGLDGSAGRPKWPKRCPNAKPETFPCRAF